MTVNATTSAVLIPGTGTTSVLPFTWQIAQASDLIVMTQVVATGVITTLALGTGFSVQGAGIATGGTVTLTAGNLPTGTNAFIASDPAELQLLLLSQANNANQADIMAALDLLTRMVQANRRLVNNALQIPLVESLAGLTTTFPAAAERANLFPAFDSLGNVFASPGPTGTGVPISPAMVPVVQAPTLAAGRLALGISAAMDPVVTAATTTIARGLLGPYSDALALATGASATRTLADQFADTINVKNYGAKGDGATDDAAAIRLAYAAIPATGGCLYFPDGVYVYGSQLAFTRAIPFAIVGRGIFASILKPTFAAGDSISISGTGQFFSLQGIQFSPSVNRNQGTYDLSVTSAAAVVISNVFFYNAFGSCLSVVSCNTINMTNVTGGSTQSGTFGDTVLNLKNTGGTISNCYLRTSGSAGNYSRGPCALITGTATSLKIGNSVFTGGGPRSKWTVNGITSSAPSFVVTAPGHDFQAGDFLVLRGMTPSAYNSQFRITSVTTTTITVTSALNPGTSSVNGTAESIAACVLISNESGAVNESSFDNVLFEATQTNLYGTAGLYFDGRRGTPGAKFGLAGWGLSNLYYDFGATSLLISGDNPGAGNVPTCAGFVIDTANCAGFTRSVHLDQASGVILKGYQAEPGGSSIAADQVGQPCGLYVYPGPAPSGNGLTVNGCTLGMPKTFDPATYATRGMVYGMLIDGLGLNDLEVVGNQFYGQTFAIIDNGAVQGNQVTNPQRWQVRQNVLTSGTAPIASSTVIPSLASAASISLVGLFQDRIKITGTTGISTITGGWVDREIQLVFPASVTLGTGGNLAITAPYVVLAGQMVTLVFDGSNWYVK